MGEVSRELNPKPAAPGLQAEPARSARLLSCLERVWPQRLPVREIAGLPACVVDLLRPGRYRVQLLRAAAELDRALPGWTELAAGAIAEARGQAFDPQLQRAAALLARRPLSRPEPLLRALSSCPGEARLWLLVALAGTDSAEARAASVHQLRRWAASPEVEAAQAAWFAFARAFLGGWLEWSDFHDCLASQVLAAAGPRGDYRPALDRLGLRSHPGFAKWYRQAVYEISHQPDARLSFQTGGWIRDFPGEDYLWSALDELERKPDSWWPLHVVRWVSLATPEAESTIARLRGHSGPVLSLLSLIRPDLVAAVGQVLELARHQEAISWLKTASPAAPLDVGWIGEVLAPWVERLGDEITLAAGALCSTDPPADFEGPEPEAVRRRAFLRQHLVPEFDRVMDNLFYVHALRKQYFPLICQRAARGLPTALRALALWPEQAEASAPVLFRLSREGTSASRQAAREALEVVRAHTGVGDLEQLERRVDLASAWADAGLEGRPARAWWDVGGYHLRLAVAAGKVQLEVYSRARRLASVPAKLRGHPQYEEIRQAHAQLAKSYRYFRSRLEQAMVEGLEYSGGDLAVLLANPVVRSLASRLVLAVDGNPFQWSPEDPLADCQPPREIATATRITVAHPVDLLHGGRLEEWQERVIEGRIAQPFKQVFRELYLLGEGERSERSCLRFAERPLLARQAFALLRSCGYAPGSGDAVKQWPRQGLRAHISWAKAGEDVGRRLGGLDEADPVTSGAVWFESDAGEALPLGSVSSLVLSETLREADLLVSRAAAGELGFSSAETRRLRGTLVRYLARALRLTTVYVSEDEAHAIVEGQRAIYRVHLGSGSVLLEKSRLHLDFGLLLGGPVESLMAESMDSFTARILGLILALSHDDRITDPEFLRQIGTHYPG